MAEHDILAGGLGKNLLNSVDLLPTEWQRPVKGMDSQAQDTVSPGKEERAAVEEAPKSWRNPDGTVKWDEAQEKTAKFLEDRADDPTRKLSSSDRAIMKTLGKAFMNNDMEGVRNLLNSYQANPRDLRQAMWALSQDMKEGGLVFDYNVVQRNGKDEGVFRFHMDTANSYTEMSTNPNTSTELRGPLVGMNDREYDPRDHAKLERSGDYLYGNEKYTGVLDFFVDRFPFSLRMHEKLSAKGN